MIYRVGAKCRWLLGEACHRMSLFTCAFLQEDCFQLFVPNYCPTFSLRTIPCLLTYPLSLVFEPRSYVSLQPELSIFVSECVTSIKLALIITTGQSVTPSHLFLSTQK